MHDQRPVIVSGHAINRARARVPALSAAAMREVRDVLSLAVQDGVVVGGQQGRDAIVETTIPSSGQKVALAVVESSDGTTVIKTVLTPDQATANAQMFGHSAAAGETDSRQPRGQRVRDRTDRRRRRYLNQAFSTRVDQRYQSPSDDSRRRPPRRQRAKTTREFLDAEGESGTSLVV